MSLTFRAVLRRERPILMGSISYSIESLIDIHRILKPSFYSPKSPCDRGICSAIEPPIRSARVPDHIMGPFANDSEFHDFLFFPASTHASSSDTTEEYIKVLAQATEIRKYPLTSAHNVLIGDDSHLSGFLDLESAGWLLEYWEFTTAMRFGRRS